MEPTVREFGRKPYIDPGKGLDGGYVNAMRRVPQKSEFDNPRVAMMRTNQRRGSIDQNDTRKVVTTPLGLISEYVSDAVIWGMTFDNSSGLYIAKDGGDILYRPAGSAVFGALSQTSRNWEEMACMPNGDILAVVFGTAIYIRAGGAGDFTLLQSAGFTCVESDPNGDAYALAGNQLYVRTGGAGNFLVIAEVTTRGYTGLACAPNGDLYATETGTGKVYIRTGRAGDLVELQDIGSSARSICAAPNGDIYLTPYSAFDFNIYRRTGGAGSFEAIFNSGRYVNDMSVSPAGYLYLSSNLNLDYQIHQLNTDTGIQDPLDTIVQRHPTPMTREQPLRKNLKPYANKSYEEMQQFARPIEYTGTERQPETVEAKPILVDHIPPVTWYVRSGAPVVIDIPTTRQDPVSRIEVLGGDGFASVAPNTISVIYKPGLSNMAALVVHTRSGQQCTVNLIAK